MFKNLFFIKETCAEIQKKRSKDHSKQKREKWKIIERSRQREYREREAERKSEAMKSRGYCGNPDYFHEK